MSHQMCRAHGMLSRIGLEIVWSTRQGICSASAQKGCATYRCATMMSCITKNPKNGEMENVELSVHALQKTEGTSLDELLMHPDIDCTQLVEDGENKKVRYEPTFECVSQK